MIDCARISEAIAVYDPNADVEMVAKAEEQRRQFLDLFPRSEWAAMTLERYALGQAEHQNTFCRWMEFVTTEFSSMKGGNAKKHLIYYQTGNKEWYFDKKMFVNVDDAWRAVHQGFMDAISYAEAGEWEAIADIAALRGGPALVNKTLSMYYPDELLPINSQTHLRHFLRELGDSRADDSNLGTTSLNRILLSELRTCGALDGRTTKEIERLLYSSDLDPFTAGQLDGPITNVAKFIADTLAEAGDDRLEARRNADDEARRLLDGRAGKMDESDVRELLRLFNVDFNKGRPVGTRFSPAFVGQTARALASNLDNLNAWTGQIWHVPPDAAALAIDQLFADKRALPSAGTTYPTMLMYLRDPEKNAVWGRITDKGLQRLTDYKPTRSPAAGRLDDYERFCSAAQQLMVDHNIPPELLDYLLAEAGRATEVDEPPAEPGNVWLFQANPGIYNIDQALAEYTEMPWVVRQRVKSVRTGDRVYLWRSGQDAGVVATATVITDPAPMPGEKDDPFVLKPEALSKTENRVRLRIDSVLPSVVRRVDLIGHPILNGLAVIRQPNATNFEVTAAQDEALRRLVSDFQIPQISEDLERRVHLPRPWLQEAIDLLSEKGQIVFYGPPGTGKTFVALALAEEITKNGGAHRIVQFHPSYSYEDFVGGFRPIEDDGAHGVRYQRTDGPLRAIAAEAAADPSNPYVLIIDEINRGNIPKIFGELLFLLEYRQKEARLQYWPEEPFSLPKNLLLIGTMNTADRSIALVDAALRRRFYFVPFVPTTAPVKDVLGKWLRSYELSEEPAQLLVALNQEIAKDDISIGPSYFMTDPQAGPALERIWSRAVMPLLDEYYFGTNWDRSRFELASLRARLTRDAPRTDGDDSTPGDEPG